MTSRTIYLRALRILWSEEKILTALLLGAGVLVGLIQIIEPVLFGRVIDALGSGGQVFQFLLGWGIFGLFNIIASVYLAVMSDRLAHRQRLKTLDQVFERVIALPLSYYSEQGSGRVVHVILTGTDQLFHLWLSFMREHLSSFAGIILLVPLASSLDIRMSSLLIVLALLYSIANYQIVKKTHTKQEQVTTYHHDLAARIGDVIGNVTVVQSYARFWEEINALQRIMSQLLTAQYPVLTWWGLLSVITRLSSALTMIAILSLGSWLVSLGELSVGEVVSFVSFSGFLIGKLEQISGFVSRTMTQTPTLNKFFSLLDQTATAIDLPHARPLPPIKGKVTFENVSYRYQNSTAGIFNISFQVEAGQTVALVGPTGSGKTTTLALLQRLFDPQEGLIQIDDQDIRQFTLNSLRQSIATVLQDSGLFNRSIAENIRVGRPEATDEEVIAAAQLASAHEFILEKPGQYNFIIGERGSALSGGERQRIAIARAILKNSSILILDEATSALDNETESRIKEALEHLHIQEKTTFIIAHRLSTVVSADQILVFEKGQIVERGFFVELVRQNGLFARLVKMGELTSESSAERKSKSKTSLVLPLNSTEQSSFQPSSQSFSQTSSQSSPSSASQLSPQSPSPSPSQKGGL